jgi:hypothetical protein
LGRDRFLDKGHHFNKVEGLSFATTPIDVGFGVSVWNFLDIFISSVLIILLRRKLLLGGFTSENIAAEVSRVLDQRRGDIISKADGLNVAPEEIHRVCQFETFLCGIAFLQMFVQSNFTGPTFALDSGFSSEVFLIFFFF